MAGTALTTPYQMTQPAGTDCFKGEWLINNGDIINEGDLVGFVTSGGVTYITPASKTAGGIVKAAGVAFFPGNNSTATSRTGDGTTVKCALARHAIITNANSTLVPALGGGKPIYLGPVGTSTVSNYTCTLTSTNGDEMQFVGFVSPDGTTLEVWVGQPGFQFQTAGNSTVNFA